MTNKLTELNNHLFAQLERLSDPNITDEQVRKESTRTKAIVAVSHEIIENATLSIKAAELVARNGGANYKDLLPEVDSAEKRIPNYHTGKVEIR